MWRNAVKNVVNRNVIPANLSGKNIFPSVLNRFSFALLWTFEMDRFKAKRNGEPFSQCESLRKYIGTNSNIFLYYRVKTFKLSTF